MSASPADEPCGVLVVDKPRGPTSHDIVFRVRKALRTRAVGHAGTLDPMATGVLVVAVGEATKLVPWLVDERKAYETTIALGVETDTLDAEGRETRRVECPPSPDLDAALAIERARSAQVPPAFSAIQQGGERAYARARRGETVTLPPREVAIHRLELVAFHPEVPSVEVVVEASKGYYVRALARDLASALGTVGHLTRLRRVRSGSFTLEGAVSPDATPDVLRASLLPLAVAATRALVGCTLTTEGAEHARHGRRVPRDAFATPPPGLGAWLDGNGELVAVGSVDADGVGRVVRGFSR
jgi:tRNA pseudouridine55 synthase